MRQDPRKAFEHHCKTIGIDGSALERWEDGQYMRSHVQLMWQAYQWGMTSDDSQPNTAEPVAWIDDGTTGVNRNSEFRVVTDVTKQGMHASLAAKFSTPLYAVPQPNAAADGWISVDVALPRCDGEAVYIGENSSGHIACFNEFDGVSNCFMLTPDEYTHVFSELVAWRRVHRRAFPTLNASDEGNGHA